MLRIFAPESPYENDTLKVRSRICRCPTTRPRAARGTGSAWPSPSPLTPYPYQMVFELFISQLRGLQDDEGASFARYTYLVERLAMVKSFVLMLDLNFDDLVRQLVEVLLESASEAHPIRVSGYMMSIIVTTLEVSLSPQPSHTKPNPNPNPRPNPNPNPNPQPYPPLQELAEDGIPTPLLDAILENLLPARRAEKPASYQLARQVLERCADDLQQPLQAFIEGCLPTGSGMTVESEIREEWPQLLFELSEIMPEMVTSPREITT